MKKLLFAFLFFYGNELMSQQCGASFNLQAGYPMGSFKNFQPDPIGGGRINFIFKPAWQIPLYTGFELGYQRSLAKTSTFKAASLGMYDLYKVKLGTRILSALASARLSVKNERAFLRPFAEVLIGGNNFKSIVTVKKQTASDYMKVPFANSAHQGWAFTYGGSLGLAIRLQTKGNCYLELKASYLEGTKIKNLTELTLNPDGLVVFDSQESETDMFVPQVGLRFNFN